MQRFFFFLIISVLTCSLRCAADDQPNEQVLHSKLIHAFMPMKMLSSDLSSLHCALRSCFCNNNGTAANAWYVASTNKGMVNYLSAFFYDMSQSPKGIDTLHAADWNNLAVRLGLMYDSANDLGQVIEPLPLKEKEPLYLCGVAMHLEGYDEPYAVEFGFDGCILRHAVLNRDACIPTEWYNDTAVYYALRNEEDDQVDVDEYIKAVPYAQTIEGKKVSYAPALCALLQQEKWQEAGELFFSKKHAVYPGALIMLDYAAWKKHMNKRSVDMVEEAKGVIARQRLLLMMCDSNSACREIQSGIDAQRKIIKNVRNAKNWDGSRTLDGKSFICSKKK